MLEIPAGTWELSEQGAGETIIDSRTTLSYFADPSYEMIRKAFVKQIKEYPLVKYFPVLAPCKMFLVWTRLNCLNLLLFSKMEQYQLLISNINFLSTGLTNQQKQQQLQNQFDGSSNFRVI